MAIRRKVKAALEAPPIISPPYGSYGSPDTEFDRSPSVFDDTQWDDRTKKSQSSAFQALMNTLGVGTRVVGGWASQMGGPIGAGIGAGAEGIAQGFENVPRMKEAYFEALPELLSEPDAPEGYAQEVARARIAGSLEGMKTPLKRIGVEAAVSAVPASALFKGQRMLGSALRTGALGAAGEAGREKARGEDLNWQNILGIGALSAGLGAGVSKFLPEAPVSTGPSTLDKIKGFFTPKVKVPKAPGSSYEVTTTAVPEGEVLGGGKITVGKGGKTTLAGATSMPVGKPGGEYKDYAMPSKASPAPSPRDLYNEKRIKAGFGPLQTTRYGPERPVYGPPRPLSEDLASLNKPIDDIDPLFRDSGDEILDAGGNVVNRIQSGPRVIPEPIPDPTDIIGRVPYGVPDASSQTAQVDELQNLFSNAMKSRDSGFKAEQEAFRRAGIQTRLDDLTPGKVTGRTSQSATDPTTGERISIGQSFKEKDLNKATEEGEDFLTTISRMARGQQAPDVLPGGAVSGASAPVLPTLPSGGAVGATIPKGESSANLLSGLSRKLSQAEEKQLRILYAEGKLDEVGLVPGMPEEMRSVFVGWLNAGLNPRQAAAKFLGRQAPKGMEFPTPVPKVPSSPLSAAEEALADGKIPSVGAPSSVPPSSENPLGDLLSGGPLRSTPDYSKMTTEGLQRRASQLLQRGAGEDPQGELPVIMAELGRRGPTKPPSAPTSAAPIPDVPPTQAPPISTPPPVSPGGQGEVPSELAQFFRTPQERAKAAGSIYGNLQKAVQEGDVENPVARAWGARVFKEAKEAGLPAPTPAEREVMKMTRLGMNRPNWVEEETSALGKFLSGEQPRPQAATAAPDWAQKEMDALDLLKGQKGEIDPELLLTGVLTGGGALAGAAMDNEGSPWEGAAAGAAAGLGVAGLGRAAQNPAFRKNMWKVAEMIPRIQRTNYLADVVGLPANAAIGPWSAAFLGGAEDALAGDPRGKVLMGLSKNPVNFMKDLWKSKDEAYKLLKEGELGRAEGLGLETAESGSALDQFNRYLAIPGQAMTMGDVASRKLMGKAGYSDPESRIMTMTNEAIDPSLRQWQNAGKGGAFGPLLETLFPYKRTPINIFEQGFERLPGIGSLVHAARQDADLRRVLAQQGIAIPLAITAYLAGENLPPEVARHVKRIVTNASGRYALGSGIAFAAGQMNNPDDTLPSSTRLRFAAENIMPMPSADPLVEGASWAFGDGPPPRGMYPGFLRQTAEVLDNRALANFLGLENQKRRPRIRRRRRE